MDRQFMAQMITLYIILSVFAWNSANNVYVVGDDAVALMKLKISLQDTADLDQKLKNWTRASPPCHDGSNHSSWYGIQCLDGIVSELRLENMELQGSIEHGELATLTGLRRLSLKNNSLSGPLPDISDLGALKAVDFSNNNFAGPVPDNFFVKMKALKNLWLCYNDLSGEIPSSLANLPRLMKIQLQNNSFTGRIPAFDQKSLVEFNVSNNNLNGKIPQTSVMQGFNSSCFDGNPGLCGSPLSVNCTETRSHGLATETIIVIIVADAGVLFIISLIFVCYYRARSAKKLPAGCETKSADGNSLPDDLHLTKASASNNKNNNTKECRADADQKEKLVFFGDDRPGFELDDLLRASAELLGKGNFGSAYKAMLEGGRTLLVKRLREMKNLGKEEFEHHMQALGRLKHPNLVPLTSYFYSKEEKLLVYNFIATGSLHSLLYGDRSGPGRVPLNWATRLKIIKGVARGLDYLHLQCQSQEIPHGDLTSSNVLLDENFEPRLSDYGLASLISPPLAAERMMAFKAPEYLQYRKLSPKADVWSFGVLLLEILTGHVHGKGGAGVDLPRWVHYVVREEWTGEVFDREISLSKYAEGDMLRALQIAMWCTDNSPEQRPNMNEVLRKIEGIIERADHDNNQDGEDYSMQSEGDVVSEYSSYLNTPDLSYTPPQEGTPK